MRDPAVREHTGASDNLGAVGESDGPSRIRGGASHTASRKASPQPELAAAPLTVVRGRRPSPATSAPHATTAALPLETPGQGMLHSIHGSGGVSPIQPMSAPPIAGPAISGVAGVSRDEMNLAEFPLAVLSTRVDPTIKTLEFTDHFRNKNGELVERKWIITGADKFGLPTSTDDDVVLGLIRLTMDQGFRGRKIYFTRYELLKTLRWSTEGRSYSRLVKSLDRLSGVRIRSANSFYDNVSKSYQTCNFGIIDSYEINDHRSAKSDDGEPPQSFFVWSEMLFDSFRCGFIKKLDLDLYFSLRSSVSRRLYRYLDKHFYFRPTVERPLMLLAFEKLGISRNYKYVSSIRQQLEPAAEELVRIGFLQSFDFSGKGDQTVVRFVSQQAGSTQIAGAHFAPNPQAARGYPAQAGAAQFDADLTGMPFGNGDPGFYDSQPLRVYDEPTAPRSGGRSDGPRASEARGADPRADLLRLDLERSLVMRGITSAQASRLVAALEPDQLQRAVAIISFYDYLVSTNDHRVSRNKLGFLYRAIESPEKIKLPSDMEPARDSSHRSGAAEGSGGVRTDALKGGARHGVRERGGAVRPEHRIIRATSERRSPSRAVHEQRAAEGQGSLFADPARQAPAGGRHSENALQLEYREFFEHSFTEGVTKLPAAEVDAVYRTVERKMTCLRSVLTEQRFNEALEGCVRDELMKLLDIPTFTEWAGKRAME